MSYLEDNEKLIKKVFYDRIHIDYTHINGDVYITIKDMNTEQEIRLSEFEVENIHRDLDVINKFFIDVKDTK